jgi:cysteine desulfurase
LKSMKEYGRIYLDHNATSPPLPEVTTAVARIMTESWGNPSTLYATGRQARRVLDVARTKVAGLIGAEDPSELTFTSGGTEGDNLALVGVCQALANRGDYLITSMAEHKAVLETCAALEGRGFRVTYLPVDGSGRVHPDAVRRAIRPGTILVSVILANNEVGTINPVVEISHVCREAGVLFHTDAVQGVGKIPVDVRALGVDLLTLSAHKFSGPRGVGAIWVRTGIPIQPVLRGGAQERGLRPGTENVPAIHGFGVAAELARRRLAEHAQGVRSLRDQLCECIRREIPQARVHGDLVDGLPNVLNVSFPAWDAEEMVIALDREGIEAGTGSACTTGQTAPSHVLLAMGVPPDEATRAVRFSLGPGNTNEDIDTVASVLARLCRCS